MTHSLSRIVQAKIGVAASVGLAVRGFFWNDTAAWAVSCLALAFALMALYNEFKIHIKKPLEI